MAIKMKILTMKNINIGLGFVALLFIINSITSFIHKDYIWGLTCIPLCLLHIQLIYQNKDHET